jgi:hypothetical protein
MKLQKSFLFSTIPDRNVQTTEEEEPDTDVFGKTLTYAIPKNGYRNAMGLWNYLKDRKGHVLNWKGSGGIVVHVGKKQNKTTCSPIFI